MSFDQSYYLDAALSALSDNRYSEARKLASALPAHLAKQIINQAANAELANVKWGVR